MDDEGGLVVYAGRCDGGGWIERCAPVDDPSKGNSEGGPLWW